MKSPLGKLKKLALHKSDAKDKKDHHSSLALSDGLAQASQSLLVQQCSCYALPKSEEPRNLTFEVWSNLFLMSIRDPLLPAFSSLSS
nr:uncharacterized protein At2g33490-like [Ipomoea batatas]GMC55645.1 uncharacterized protein At2g33490-like [Ipomoea batatas]